VASTTARALVSFGNSAAYSDRSGTGSPKRSGVKNWVSLADHAFQPLLEHLLLVYVLAVLGYAVAPQGFELAPLDRAALGEMFDQRVKHRMVI
jgi:hypothetical protein